MEELTVMVFRYLPTRSSIRFTTREKKLISS